MVAVATTAEDAQRQLELRVRRGADAGSQRVTVSRDDASGSLTTRLMPPPHCEPLRPSRRARGPRPGRWARRRRRRAPRARRRRAAGQRAPQHLAALREPGPHQREQPVGRRHAHRAAPIAGAAARAPTRPWAGARTPSAAPSPTTWASAKYATFTDTAPYCGSPGAGGEPLPHLPLHHHEDAVDRLGLLEQSHDDRRGDVVRQVRHARTWRRQRA